MKTPTARVRHLTSEELAERLGITVQALYAHNKRGTGPVPMRPSGRARGPLRWRLADVEAWEESRLVTPPAAGIS